MEGRVFSWNDEVVARLESRKCATCHGSDTYICECAKKAWLLHHKIEDQDGGRQVPKCPPQYKKLAYQRDDGGGWGDLDAPRSVDDAQRNVSL